MKKPGLKLPKRLKQSVPSVAQPQTAEEYVEQGADLEESGDRWLGSDLSKALRFFQKAFNMYTEGMKLSEPGHLDGYYNASRLLFHVYSNFTKQDGVNFRLLSNVNEAIDGSDRAVVQPLSNIILAHKTAIDFAQKSSVDIPLDLLFNTVLVNTEDIESKSSGNDVQDLQDILSIGHQSLQIISEVLNRQLDILKAFVDELKRLDNSEQSKEFESNSNNVNNAPEETLVEGEQVIQPSDVYETVVVAFKLIQAISESMILPEYSLTVIELINTFTNNFDVIREELEQNFTTENPYLESILQEQVEDLIITKMCIKQCFENDLNQLTINWDDTSLPNTPERFMLAADNIHIYLERNDISLNTVNKSESDSTILWQALSKMTNLYKTALELENKKVADIKKGLVSQQDGLGSVIAQICAIYIERADIDIQRSQIQTANAIQSKPILEQNCKNFLKSAANVANTSGGLRERAIEKLARGKKRVEALVRLCLVEGNISVQELDSKVGRERWIEEIPYLNSTGIFESFGISQIEIPTPY